MTTVKLVACGLFLGAGLVQLVSSFVRPHRRLSAAMLLLFAVALVLTIDTAYLTFDRLTHVPNLADLVSHLAGLTGIGLMTYLLLDVDGRARHVRRRELTGLALVLFASCAAFAATDAPREAPAFTAAYGDQTPVIVFWIVSAGYALICLVRLASTVRHATPAGTRKDVVVGMRLAAMGGGAFGVVYIGLKVAELALSDVDFAGPSGLERWQQVALVPGMACLAVGLGLPLMLRAGHDLAQQIRYRLALTRLRAVRARLLSMGLVVDDGTNLSSEGSILTDLLGVGASGRLLRRVVEIRDALLVLPDSNPVADLQPRSISKGTTSARLDLAAEATRLAVVGRARCDAAAGVVA